MRTSNTQFPAEAAASSVSASHSSYALPWVLCVWLTIALLAARSYNPSDQQLLTNSPKVQQQRWCAFGSLTGYWSSAVTSARHWRIFDSICQLQDLLPQYSALQDEIIKRNETIKDAEKSPRFDESVGGAQELGDPIGILFLSDSVDKHILTYMCDLMGGQVMLMSPEGTPIKPMPRMSGSSSSTTTSVGGGSSSSSSGGVSGIRGSGSSSNNTSGGVSGIRGSGSSSNNTSGGSVYASASVVQQRRRLQQQQQALPLMLGDLEPFPELIQPQQQQQQQGRQQQQQQRLVQGMLPSVTRSALGDASGSAATSSPGHAAAVRGLTTDDISIAAGSPAGSSGSSSAGSSGSSSAGAGASSSAGAGASSSSSSGSGSSGSSAAAGVAVVSGAGPDGSSGGSGAGGDAAAGRASGAADPAAAAAAAAAGGNRYLTFTCQAAPGAAGGPGRPLPLRLAALYFPGVHPTGPFHKGVRANYSSQMADAVRVWGHLAKGASPDIVVVSSMLWDLARMSAHEPHFVAGPELPPEVLNGWIANYTQVVNYARGLLPEARMFAYHTTMAPRFDPVTGAMARSYLGRRFFVSQLNAAGRHVAARLGMEVVDYASIANRFLEGQQYLVDLIHPNREVGLEIANIYLNYAQQLRAAHAADPTWRHPSRYTQPAAAPHAAAAAA